MRPPDLDVTLRLFQLDCAATEDSNGDEPYMWVLGFKVDADTLGDLPASLIPELGVKVFEGTSVFRFIKAGAMSANETPCSHARRAIANPRARPARSPAPLVWGDALPSSIRCNRSCARAVSC